MAEMPPAGSGWSSRLPMERASSNASSRCREWRRSSTVRATTLRLVQPDRCADQLLKRVLVDPFALADVDRAPGVALQARVEEARGVLQRCALGEGELDCALVGLAGADHSVV